jgi:hypothetical protein
MSINTHCQELFQWNKDNEQQSHIHEILRNLGNKLGKTPMWGNPERERERERDFISFRKVYQRQYYIFQQEKSTYITQHSHSFLPRNLCQIHTIVWPSFARQHLEKCAKNKLYEQNCTAPSTARNTPKNLDFCAHNLPQKTCPLPCCMECTDPYSTTSLTKINFS